MSKRGLPAGVRMRHDSHYVEELATQRPTPIGRLISVDLLDPNPEQPRVEIGDLTELIDSIRDKGVLEPLLVKPFLGKGRWLIIAGERRWRAARSIGLREVPCIVMDVDDRAVAEIALIENLQRKDLTPWEEADGLLALCVRFGYTHEDVAKKIGKSRSTVTESLAIASLPKKIRELCKESEIKSKSLLLQVVRQPDEKSMENIIAKIRRDGLTRDDAREMRKGSDNEHLRPDTKFKKRNYIYRYVPPNSDFKMELKFEGVEEVSEAKVLEHLKYIVRELESRRETHTEE